MHGILKDFRNTQKHLTSDSNEQISVVIYIASLSEDLFDPHAINIASKVVYYALTNICGSYAVVETLLTENDTKESITIRLESSRSDYEVHVKDKWLFQTILLNSVKFSGYGQAKSNDRPSANFLRTIVTYINKYTLIDKPNSAPLLHTLHLIVSRHKDILPTVLSVEILKCMNKVALSPLTYFKSSTESISKILLSTLSASDQKLILDVDLLPIRGVDTRDVVNLFTKSFMDENRAKIVKKVLQLFLNNTESKDGGVLYGALLSCTFNEWTVNVWPLFEKELQRIEHEGEFFHSLLHYWIPRNVSEYKRDFYMFLRDKPVDCKIKAYALLQTRKERCVISDDLQTIFHSTDLATVGLRIISTYHKKSLRPQERDVSMLLSYLYSNLNPSLADDEIRSVQMFLSQLFLYAHNDLKKTKANVESYAEIVERVCRFCLGSLKTDFFEVGAQVLHVTLDIATGSHKQLCLNYKREARDMYDAGENLLYKEMLSRSLWELQSETVVSSVTNCFINEGFGTELTKLVTSYYVNSDTFSLECLRGVVHNTKTVTLRNLEKVRNYTEVVLKSDNSRSEKLLFLMDVQTLLCNNLRSISENYNGTSLHQNIIFLEVLLVAIRNKFIALQLRHTLEQCLNAVDFILENNLTTRMDYTSTKIVEAFINNVLLCLSSSRSTWENRNKKKILETVIKVIQRSNMKRPVSLSERVLEQYTSSTNETESEQNLRLRFLDSTLKSIYETPSQQGAKIRRNPESRLVIHALCCSDNPHKSLHYWAMHSLLDVITDAQSTDASISSALHSIEILVSDEDLLKPNLPFTHDIIVKCVELFGRSSWIVRNADLQLAKALIERLYGVSLSDSSRPKSILDLFLLYPDLAAYFFKVLSSDTLDDRAVLVFQFFFESQVRDHAFTQHVSQVSRECFLVLFSFIIKHYGNNYGKLAVRSYVALCFAKEIPKVMSHTTSFLISNFATMKRNIFANFAFLIKELYEKYENSFDHALNDNGMKTINYAVHSLVVHLRQFDDSLFNLLLLKIKHLDVILDEFVKDDFKHDLERRLWLHNNMPFVTINAKSAQVCEVLRTVLSEKLPSCLHVKILTILASRFERSEFSSGTITDILEILLQKSVAVQDGDRYLLNCYFKTITVFRASANCATLLQKEIKFNHTNNLHKLMIYVVYLSVQKNCSVQDNFYQLVEKTYIRSIGINEDTDNDIMSTLIYIKKDVPADFRLTVLKLVFYFAMLQSTYVEAYNFICSNAGKSYFGILAALKDFLSIKNLREHLENERNIAKFLLDVRRYLKGMPDNFTDCDGYYSVESDHLMLKLVLQKMLTCD